MYQLVRDIPWSLILFFDIMDLCSSLILLKNNNNKKTTKKTKKQKTPPFLRDESYTYLWI